MTKPARFTQSDLARALKAFGKAGVSVKGAKIERDGSIIVLTGTPDAANDAINPLDRVLQR
jgi:hypothetical protein